MFGLVFCDNMPTKDCSIMQNIKDPPYSIFHNYYINNNKRMTFSEAYRVEQLLYCTEMTYLSTVSSQKSVHPLIMIQQKASMYANCLLRTKTTPKKHTT